MPEDTKTIGAGVIAASALEHLANLTPEEREALTLSILEDGADDALGFIRAGAARDLVDGELGRIDVHGDVNLLPGAEGATITLRNDGDGPVRIGNAALMPTLGEAHILAPGQAFGNRAYLPVAALTEAEIRDVQVRAKFEAAKIGVVLTSASSIRRNLGLAVLADTGGVIADVLEARARSYDHPNLITLEQDREAIEARDAAHQARMMRKNPDLRAANRTDADRARMAAAEERRKRRAQRK